MTPTFRELSCREGPGYADDRRQSALPRKLDFSAFVGDEATDNPKPKAATEAGRILGVVHKAFGEIIGEAGTLVPDFDDQRALRHIGAQLNHSASGRRRASIDQEYRGRFV